MPLALFLAFPHPGLAQTPADLLSRCAAGQASACVEGAAFARWEWAVSALRAEYGEDLPRWHRLDQAERLVEWACDLGHAAACVESGKLREACRAGDAASCDKADQDPSAAGWLAERCAAGADDACRRLDGGNPGVEVRVLPLPPRGREFYLPDGSLAAFTDRGLAMLGPGGWQLTRLTGWELPAIRGVTPVDDGLVVSFERWRLRYLLIGPEGARWVDPDGPPGHVACAPLTWSPDGLGIVAMGKQSPDDCKNGQGLLVAIDAESGESTELTLLTEALNSRIQHVAIARGWVAATGGPRVVRARLAREGGQLVLGPVERIDRGGRSVAVSDTGAVATHDVVWTDTVTELDLGSSPVLAGNRLAAPGEEGIRSWDLGAGEGWASQPITLPHRGHVQLDPGGRELLIRPIDQLRFRPGPPHVLLRVLLQPAAPEPPSPPPPRWSPLEVPVLPDPPAPADPNAAISGRILSGGDPSPVARVEVDILPRPWGEPGAAHREFEPIRLRTRRDGTFDVTGLDSSVPWTARAWSEEGCAQGTGDLRLGSCWGVEVTVVDADGEAVRGARVWAEGGGHLPEQLFATREGTFRWLGAGDLPVRIMAAHPDGRWASETMRTTDGPRPSRLPLTAAPRLTLRLVDALGAPLPGASVHRAPLAPGGHSDRPSG